MIDSLTLGAFLKLELLSATTSVCLMWFPGSCTSSSSLQGAAFGFIIIAAKAGEQLAPFLPQLVPRLYRYQFDPNMAIRQAMTSIWDALVTDKTLVTQHTRPHMRFIWLTCF